MKVNFEKTCSKVKPMHATNNGPVVLLRDVEMGTLHPFNNNLQAFKDAGIPYARTHDTTFYHRFGLEHTVDVYYVFPNFDADPTDPNNYDFACTDQYVQGCYLANTEVFYRLGHRIEHEIKKYGTLPPKDFQKWAVICEHIIRHYTEGWADGFHFNMTYWEIWNEPDLTGPAGMSSPTWGGTREEFFEFYHIAATHLKQCFPHLKIGGPALAYDLQWAEAFLSQLKAPLDFFSWHVYTNRVEYMVELGQKVRSLLDRYGFTQAESILNEWNYVSGWTDDDIVYSHDHRGKVKGAAFSAAAMCACQYSTVDMLMYYDARPNEFWNGMFDDTVVGRVLKGYYPFPMFHELYQLENCVHAEADEVGGYICAAKSNDQAAVLLTHFNDNDTTNPKNFIIDLSGFYGENGVEVEFYLLDETHNCDLVGKATYYGNRFIPELILPNFSCYLLKLKKK